MAAAFGPPEAVKALLDAGAKIDAQDYRGFTPLMLAVGTDRYDRRIGEPGAVSRRRPSPHQSRRRDRARLGLQIRRPGSDPILGREPRRTSPSPCAYRTSCRIPAQPSRAAFTCWSSTSDQFFKKSGCFACHEQPPAEFAAAAARAKGIPVDEKASHERIRQITSTINPVALEGAAALGGADNNLYCRRSAGARRVMRPIASRIFSRRTWRHRRAATADGTFRVIRDRLCRTAIFRERRWPCEH